MIKVKRRTVKPKGLKSKISYTGQPTDTAEAKIISPPMWNPTKSLIFPLKSPLTALVNYFQITKVWLGYFISLIPSFFETRKVKNDTAKVITPRLLLVNSVLFMNHNWQQFLRVVLYILGTYVLKDFGPFFPQIVPPGPNCVFSKHGHSMSAPATDTLED